MKEAVYKALYPVHKLEWKQVSVTKKAGKNAADEIHASKLNRRL